MVEYLKLKNKVFKKIFMQLYKAGELKESLYYLEDKEFNDLNELEEYAEPNYYDLIGIYFYDEKKYSRSLFLPFPLASKKMKRILRANLDNGHIVSRDWHDSEIKDRPFQFYPEYTEYEYSVTESEDEEEVEAEGGEAHGQD